MINSICATMNAKTLPLFKQKRGFFLSSWLTAPSSSFTDILEGSKCTSAQLRIFPSCHNRALPAASNINAVTLTTYTATKPCRLVTGLSTCTAAAAAVNDQVHS